MAEHEDTDKICASCVHFHEQTDRTDDYRWGECKRFPPVWYFDGEAASCQHAQSDALSVCGEWRAKQ